MAGACVLLRREGFQVSVSTIGRILQHLMRRGVVTPVPTLRSRPGGRRFRLIGSDRHAKRLPKGLKPQGAWRYEFYAAYDLPLRLDRLQPFVDAFAHRYNHHRPHDALDGKTPAEYLNTISSSDPPASHMP